MATHGNTLLQEGIPHIKDAFVVIIKTEWNADITDELEAGALKILSAQGCKVNTYVVPGAVELPFAVHAYAKSKNKKADAFIVFGAVIKGDTPHFEYVCDSVTQGITTLNTTLNSPVIFGVLTLLTHQQAIERIGGIHGHKGEEAAITALKMIELKKSFK